MKILYLIPSFNIFGGTPKKTLDLLEYFRADSFIYSYSREYLEHLNYFRESGAKVSFSNRRGTIFSDLLNIIRIIDEEGIDIVQTQFFRGELLGFFVKMLRPNIKLVIAFVGPFNPTGVKKILSSIFYRFADSFVFISNYVKKEKVKGFPGIKESSSHTIYNGTQLRKSIEGPPKNIEGFKLLDIAGLVDWKNADVLIEAMNIIVNARQKKEIKLIVAGDGPEKNKLQEKIKDFGLQESIFLLGYQKNIGGLLDLCDVFVHPAYAEGFGISVIEAMMAEKPVIVSDAGALPELVDNEVSGLVIDAFSPRAWAEAIERLYEDKSFSRFLSENASKKAHKDFSVDRFVKSYENVYAGLTISRKESAS